METGDWKAVFFGTTLEVFIIFNRHLFIPHKFSWIRDAPLLGDLPSVIHSTFFYSYIFPPFTLCIIAFSSIGLCLYLGNIKQDSIIQVSFSFICVREHSIFNDLFLPNGLQQDYGNSERRIKGVVIESISPQLQHFLLLRDGKLWQQYECFYSKHSLLCGVWVETTDRDIWKDKLNSVFNTHE